MRRAEIERARKGEAGHVRHAACRAVCALSTLLIGCSTTPDLVPDPEIEASLLMIDQMRFPAPHWPAVHQRLLEEIEKESDARLERADGSLRAACKGRSVGLRAAPESVLDLFSNERAIRALMVGGCATRGLATGVAREQLFLHWTLAALDDGSAILPAELIHNSRANAGLRVFEEDDGGFSVHEVAPGTSAAQARIEVGSRLLAVDSVATEGATLGEVWRWLQGPPETKIEVRLRDRSGRTVTHTLERFAEEPPTVDGPQTLEGRARYIRVREFLEDTAERFAAALTEAAGAPLLIVDLRGNPGGLLDSAVESTGHLLPYGAPVATFSSRRGTATVRNPLEAIGPFERLVVLVDRNTGPGAELVAVSLREASRALIAGERTSGNGSIYSFSFLSDGGGIKLRSAQLVGGVSGVIPKGGLVPDFVISGGTVGVQAPTSDPWIHHILFLWQEGW